MASKILKPMRTEIMLTTLPVDTNTSYGIRYIYDAKITFVYTYIYIYIYIIHIFIEKNE